MKSSAPTYTAREAYHAGSWYAADAGTLRAQLEGWLAEARSAPVKRVTADAPDDAGNDGGSSPDCNGSAPSEQVVLVNTDVRAVIAPHAGYAYSGPTAAYAYRFVNAEAYDQVWVLGPSHHVYLQNCAVSGASVLRTPLGDLSVDVAVTQRLTQQHPELFRWMSQSMDEHEHSIEMHLPYVAHAFRGHLQRVRVVPVMVGALSVAMEERVGRALAEYVRQPRTLFVVSSDFCHWGQRFGYTRGGDDVEGRERQRHGMPLHQYIQQLDMKGMQAIESGVPEAYRQYQQATDNTICGRHPIAVLLHALATAAAASDPCTIRFVRYAQSSRCEDLRDSSVSYAAAVVYPLDAPAPRI